MRKSLPVRLAWIAFALLSAMPTHAHHSFAMFDGDQLVVLRGTMLSFSFMNPHVWLSIVASADADADPAAQRWDVEATSTRTLANAGIRADTFKAGDKLTVGIRPLRDHRHGGSLVFVVDASGKAYGADPAAFDLKTADLTPK